MKDDAAKPGILFNHLLNGSYIQSFLEVQSKALWYERNDGFSRFLILYFQISSHLTKNVLI